MSLDGCVTMVLAGGRGERLGALTRYSSKPAVNFGGKYRIIDFTLQNCMESGIETIGILSQNHINDLGEYVETAYGSKSGHGGFCMLPPQNSENYYKGTADAVYKNIDFIEQYKPECVMVLAGDHIYKMDYSKIMDFHRNAGADVTVAATLIPLEEASRFGIINADSAGRVRGFEEKPKNPKSCLASMGIYVFRWDLLKKYLLSDSADEASQHDFGQNILPRMLNEGILLYAYQSRGYWRDVGTVDSFWEANMEQINFPSTLQTKDNRWSDAHIGNSSYIAKGAYIYKSIIPERCSVFGAVEHSVLSTEVTVCRGAEIIDSVIMPGAFIGNNAKIYKTVVGANAKIMDNAVIGAEEGSDFFIDREVCARDVSLVAPWLCVEEHMKFKVGSHIYQERFWELEVFKNTVAARRDKDEKGAGTAKSGEYPGRDNGKYPQLLEDPNLCFRFGYK